MTAISTEVISGGIEITVVSGEGNKTGQSTKDFQYRVSKMKKCLVLSLFICGGRGINSFNFNVVYVKI